MTKFLKEEATRIKEVETTLAAEFNSKRNVLINEFNEKKGKVLENVDSLSNDLVNKLLN